MIRIAALRAAVAVAVALSVALCGGASAQTKVPRFKDYPVNQIYKGKRAEPVLATEYEQLQNLMFERAAREGPNFAGRYAVAINTCGSTCVMASFVDVRTGKITHADSNSGWRFYHSAFKSIEYRLDSRLIAFAGALREEPPVGWHYFVIQNDGELKHLSTIVVPRAVFKSRMQPR